MAEIKKEPSERGQGFNLTISGEARSRAPKQVLRDPYAKLGRKI